MKLIHHAKRQFLAFKMGCVSCIKFVWQSLSSRRASKFQGRLTSGHGQDDQQWMQHLCDNIFKKWGNFLCISSEKIWEEQLQAGAGVLQAPELRFPHSPWWDTCAPVAHGRTTGEQMWTGLSPGGLHARTSGCPKKAVTPWETYVGAGFWENLWPHGKRSPPWISFAGKICGPAGPACSREIVPWVGPTLEQCVNNCSLWERLTLEKFMMGCLLWEGSCSGAEKVWGVLHMRMKTKEKTHDKLATMQFHVFQREGNRDQQLIQAKKKGGVGERYF